MSKSDTSKGGFLDSMRAAQIVFAANPMFGPQTRHFWNAQDRILEEAEKFSSAWFKRRHEATKAAVEASSKFASDGMRDPGSAMKAIANWQTHSMERLAEDAKDCAEMMTRCASVVVSNEVEAMEETAENTRRATKASKSEPV